MSTSIKTVMIIDDNAVDLYIASRMIESNQFATTILEHNSALDALDYLQKYQDNPEQLPQVIFVDIYMPQMSGFEFMESYGNLPLALREHCKVFILSSSIDDRDIARARANNHTCSFVVKPISKEFLAEVSSGNL